MRLRFLLLMLLAGVSASAADWPTYRRARCGIAYVPQGRDIFPELTVEENVMVGACFGREGRSLGDAVSIAGEVLAFTGLKSRSAQPASSLNVAQKKRLELARALASRPYLLLLDEVLAGLNPSEVETMVQTIHQVRDQGITIIMIEHVMRAIMNVSDRIIVLDYGEQIAEGTPQEVANNQRVIEAYLGDPRLAQQFAEEGGS